MKLKIPYRINIAGAYLDCINDPVITATINKYLTFNYTKRDDNIIIVDSKEFPGLCITDLSPHRHEGNHWSEYVNGCIFAFIRNNFKLQYGCNIEVLNDLPSGIGISSSAAFIVGIIKCIAAVNNLDLSNDLVASLGYYVEHEYLNIPCGRMDFKAVLHEPGIWKVETNDCSFSSDYLISAKHYTGLLLYKEQHEHLTDERFVNIVRDIKDAKENFRQNLKAAYIDYEKAIIACIVYEAQDGKLDESYLGMFLTNTYVNIIANIFDEREKLNEIANKPEGVYGGKLLGSGLKGARFLLINKEYKDKIIDMYKNEYQIMECEI